MGDGPASQTLSRGIRLLELLADARRALSIDELADLLGVHRSIAYRLLRTLEDHGLVVREAGGGMILGARMAALAAGVARDLQAAALPELTAVANELGMTCFLAVLDHDEAVTLVSVEPRHAVASVAQRPGTRHPVTVGAPGKAILSALSREHWPTLGESARREIQDAVSRGYATSHDEVVTNLGAVAVPLVLPGRTPAAVAVVYLASEHPQPGIAARLHSAAAAISQSLGS
jgi:DNA-binding IclR family transcriptional regulator